MRVPVLLMFLTLATLLAGALTARGGEGEQLQPMMEVTEFDGSRLVIPDLDEIQGDEEFEEEIKVTVDLDNLWRDDDADTPLWVRFVRGVLRSRQMEKVNGEKYIRWEACGERIPDEELYLRATEWAVTVIVALEEVENETGIAINPWGAFATTANEGGFNECSLNFAARKWASEHVGRELITETWKGRTVKRKVTKKVVDKFRLTYDKDTVWRIINHPDYANAKVEVKGRGGETKIVRLKNKFDGGPFQIRKSVKKLTRKEFDNLLSIHPGVYMGVREMARRAKRYKYRYRVNEPHPRPWMMWPGFMVSGQRRYEYDRKITSVARWLGARRDEI